MRALPDPVCCRNVVQAGKAATPSGQKWEEGRPAETTTRLDKGSRPWGVLPAQSLARADDVKRDGFGHFHVGSTIHKLPAHAATALSNKKFEVRAPSLDVAALFESTIEKGRLETKKSPANTPDGC